MTCEPTNKASARTIAETTILVADDDDDFRSLVAETLRADGYQVVEARDGVELLSLLDGGASSPRFHPDVIISDVRMPRLSGLGILEHLKRARVKLPVVLMTGFFPASVRVLARRLGALEVLAKPFLADDLRAALSNALAAGNAL